MDYFKIVQAYYPRFYSKDDVKVFVKAEKITPEQYKEVTGDEYKATTTE